MPIIFITYTAHHLAVELYCGYHWEIILYRGVAISQGMICTKRVHLGLREVTFIEGWPYLWMICTKECTWDSEK